MPQIQSQITPIEPNPLTQPYATHEDIYGKGGYVAITTTPELPNINDHIIFRRRKVGMMVYDIRLDKFYLCDDPVEGTDNADDNWSPVAFGGTDGGGATALSELTDVSLSSPINLNQVLVYDTDGLWKNRDLVDHFNLINTIGAGEGITVTPLGNGGVDIQLNATLGMLGNVNNKADTLGETGDNWVLKWSTEDNEWYAGPVSITVEGSTDGLFAQYDEPFVVWTQAGSDLPNSLLLSDLLTPGYGITIEPGTNQNFIFSLDQNIVVLYEDMPQYTDGSLDVARQSTLESLVDLLNSFGTTDCPVGGGGILGINGGTNINITGPNAYPVINLDTNIINSTYNGLNIERPPQTQNLLLSYPDSSGNANISIEFAQSFGATFSTENPGLNISFRMLDGSKGYEHQVAYFDELFISKLRDVEITTDIVPGSILTYVEVAGEQYWTNTNEINGGNADSF
jgi:hypothetical protein